MLEAMLREILPHLRAIVRYRWQGLAVAWLVAVIGWPAVMMLPDRYEATARVYVDTDSILLPLLEGLTVQPDVEQRLLIMTKTLLSRPNLEKVVSEVDLDLAITTPKEREALIERLAKEIRLISAGGRRSGQNNLYTLSYTHNNPETAKQVVQVILNILVETTLGDSRQDSDSAQLFLEQQIREYDARLVKAEDRLMAFKRENFNVLPSQEGGFFQDLRQAEQNLEAAKLEMREAEFSRRELKNRLLEFVASFEGGEISIEGRYDERLKAMQAQLDEKKLRFTDVHPDIVELERVIKELEQLRLEEQQGRGEASGARKPEDSRLHQELTLALAQANARIASLGVRMSEYEKRARILKERISTLPEVEAELVSLSRDYEITKMKYEQLVERLESARLSESAGETGDNVKFRIIDPPWVPATPSSPNRILLLSGVLAGAIGAGLGFAVLIGFLRPVVSDMYGLAKITDLSIYGAVTLIDADAGSISAVLKRHTLFFTLSLMLVATYGAVLWMSIAGYRLPDVMSVIGKLL